MYIVECKNLLTNKVFEKTFYNHILKNDFVRKCKYSKKIKVLSVLDYTNLYD